MQPCEIAELKKLQQRNVFLETELAIMRECGHLLRASHDERFQFICEHLNVFEVRAQCRVLGVSVSGYYAWAVREPSQRVLGDIELLARITPIYEGSQGRYGSPRLHAELVAQGVQVSRKRVARLMRDNGMKATIPKKFKKTTLSDHDRRIAPNLLNREFNVERCNVVWAGDLTYIWTDEGWVYLAVLLDLASRLGGGGSHAG